MENTITANEWTHLVRYTRGDTIQAETIHRDLVSAETALEKSRGNGYTTIVIIDRASRQVVREACVRITGSTALKATQCSVPGCGLKIKVKGSALCSTHYRRLSKYGDVMADIPISTSNRKIRARLNGLIAVATNQKRNKQTGQFE